jgi:hypothetical protein
MTAFGDSGQTLCQVITLAWWEYSDGLSHTAQSKEHIYMGFLNWAVLSDKLCRQLVDGAPDTATVLGVQA